MTPEQLRVYEEAEARSYQALTNQLDDLHESDQGAARKSRRSVRNGLDQYKRELKHRLAEMGVTEIIAHNLP